MAFHALRLLMELARQTDVSPMSASELATACGISEHFTQKIMRSLRGYNIVQSVKGIAGGHYLARNADKISLGDIILAVEGGITLPETKVGGEKSSGIDAITKVWSHAGHLILEGLRTVTLADIFARYQNMVLAKDCERKMPPSAIGAQRKPCISLARLRCRKTWRSRYSPDSTSCAAKQGPREHFA